MREAWVCSRSQGQRSRRVRTSSAKRATSPATGADITGTYTDVRWSGSTSRSRSSQATVRTDSSGRPNRDKTTTSGPSSTDSLMSDSTAFESHCATRSGPRSPAASTPNRCPSTSRAPAATGSTPRRAQARSANDMPDTSSTVTRGSASSSSTVRSATNGDPGTAYSTSPPPAARAAPTRASTMAR